MSRYSTTSKWSAEKISAAAQDYFGEKGLGLKNTSQDDCCLSYTGGGGYVSITIKENNGKNYVELDVSEWDNHIASFLRKIN
ncbi:MAG: hypothetical protein RBT34_09460 [Anaerolineaceae bacterium]|jgi:hypothetical protein|nr:hypothetical protein [Anaerolineaceae bacterium]